MNSFWRQSIQNKAPKTRFSVINFFASKASRINVLLTLILMFFLPMVAQAQPEMADGLRASGKIYVVVGVVMIVFVGLMAYLINLDRKIGKLEKEMTNK